MTNDDPHDRHVECTEHGTQPAKYVCRHLVQSLRSGDTIGFWQADDAGNPRPDAWCTACEQEVQATGGEWTDESEAFAGVTLICAACYDKVKERNRP
ncbi:MAG: hypothetical protein WDZ63_03810 [Burkholderiales bacterium]